MAAIDAALVDVLTEWGGVAMTAEIAAHFGAQAAGETAYIMFLAQLAPSIESIDDTDYLERGLGLLPTFTTKYVKT